MQSSSSRNRHFPVARCTWWWQRSVLKNYKMRRQKSNDLRWSVLKIYDHATDWAGSIIMYWIDIQISLVWNIIMLILLTRYNQFIMAGLYWNSYRNNIIRIAVVAPGASNLMKDSSLSDLCLWIIMVNFVFFWTSILTVFKQINIINIHTSQSEWNVILPKEAWNCYLFCFIPLLCHPGTILILNYKWNDADSSVFYFPRRT